MTGSPSLLSRCCGKRSTKTPLEGTRNKREATITALNVKTETYVNLALSKQVQEAYYCQFSANCRFKSSHHISRKPPFDSVM